MNSMIEYNAYFGALLVEQAAKAEAGAAAGLLRVQPKAGGVASYDFASAEARSHAGLGIADYAHCSSPIRRRDPAPPMRPLSAPRPSPLAPRPSPPCVRCGGVQVLGPAQPAHALWHVG